jgi:hypothetical protein
MKLNPHGTLNPNPTPNPLPRAEAASASEAAAKPSAAAVTAAGGGVTIKFDNVDGLGSFVQVWTRGDRL